MKKPIHPALLLGVCFAFTWVVAACTSQQATTTVGGAATTVAGAEVALTAAEHVALTYAGQALCPVKGPVVWSCRDPATMTKIKALDQTAYTAVKQAEAGVATIDAAMTTINALSAAVPTATP